MTADLLTAAAEATVRYNPAKGNHRKLLGDALLERFAAAGFTRTQRGGEVVFERPIERGVWLLVYTSVSAAHDHTEGMARGDGKDAIRAVLVYRGDYGERGLESETRVNRTGPMHDIVERALERARDAWRTAKAMERCPHCGAPKLTSKAGKRYCSDRCWLPEGQRYATRGTWTQSNSYGWSAR